MQDGETNLIPIHFGVKRSKVVTMELCQHFGSDMITWVVFNLQLSYLVLTLWLEEDTYAFWGLKVKVTMELCQHFGSDTITWVVFNVQLLHFIQRCRMVRGRYLYIGAGWQEEDTYLFWVQGHNGTLSTLWFWHDNLSIFQRTAFTFHTKMQDGERKIPIHFGWKGQGHNGTLSTLILTQ